MGPVAQPSGSKGAAFYRPGRAISTGEWENGITMAELRVSAEPGSQAAKSLT
jgi:hypothetical protein